MSISPAAAVTLSSLTNVLQEHYSEAQVADATIHNIETLRLIKQLGQTGMKKRWDPRGQRFIFNVKAANAGGFGGIKSDGALPTPTTSQNRNLDIYPVWHGAQISADLRALIVNGLNRDTAYAFVSQLQQDMTSILDEARDYFDFNLHSDQATGQLTAVSVGATVTYDAGDDETTISSVEDLRYVPEGARIEFYDSAGTTQRGSAGWTVKARADFKDSGALVVDGDASGISLAAGDLIFREHIKDNTYGEIIGFPVIVAATGKYPNQLDGTSTAIDRDLNANHFWRAQVTDGAAFADLVDAIDAHLITMRKYGWGQIEDYDMKEGKKIASKYILTSYDVMTALGQDVRTHLRYLPTQKEGGSMVDLGFQGQVYNDIPLIPAANCEQKTAYFIEPKCYYYGGMSEGRWVTELSDAGGNRFNLVPGSVVQWAGMIWCWQLFCDNPRRQGKITGLNL